MGLPFAAPFTAQPPPFFEPFTLSLPLLLLPFKPLFEQHSGGATALAVTPLPCPFEAVAARLMALLVNAISTSSEEGDDDITGDSNGDEAGVRFWVPLLLL